MPDGAGDPVPVYATRLAPTRHGRRIARVYGGIEKGLREKDLLVAEGCIAGELSRVGWFASLLSPLILPGREVPVAAFPEKGGSLFFRIRAKGQEGPVMEVEADRDLGALDPGLPLFLDERPAAGFATYPAFRVERWIEGRKFTIRLPRTGEEVASFCLRAPAFETTR
jgi:hypothetical protein